MHKLFVQCARPFVQNDGRPGAAPMQTIVYIGVGLPITRQPRRQGEREEDNP